MKFIILYGSRTLASWIIRTFAAENKNKAVFDKVW